MEFVDIAILFLFVYFLMQIVVAFLMKRRRDMIKQEIADNIQRIEDKMKKILFLRIEKHGDVLYVYNQVTNEFICQGKTYDEIHDAYVLRYPGRRALVDEGKELLFKENGECLN